MSTGWIYLLSSLAGALYAWLAGRRDPIAIGFGIACGVSCGFVVIDGALWPLLPAALLGAAVLTRRRV